MERGGDYQVASTRRPSNKRVNVNMYVWVNYREKKCNQNKPKCIQMKMKPYNKTYETNQPHLIRQDGWYLVHTETQQMSYFIFNNREDLAWHFGKNICTYVRR